MTDTEKQLAMQEFAAKMKTLWQCQQCGECCRSLILEATDLDALREVRIFTECEPVLGMDEFGFLLNRTGGQTSECVFLRNGNHCDIYPTRPNCCVQFGPDDERCAQRRAK